MNAAFKGAICIFLINKKRNDQHWVQKSVLICPPGISAYRNSIRSNTRDSTNSETVSKGGNVFIMYAIN